MERLGKADDERRPQTPRGPVLGDERAPLVVVAERDTTVARDKGKVQRLDDRQEGEDEPGEGAITDHVVALVVKDAVQDPREDDRAGDVALAGAERVPDRGQGQERLGREDKDAREDRRVRLVVAVREERKARDQDEHDRPRVPEREGWFGAW
jgi:hypothetical protein